MKNYLIITGILVAGFILTFAGKGINDTQVQNHVVLLKWKSIADSASIVEMDSLWQRLNDDIEGFDAYEMHPLQKGEYDHVVIMKFNSVESHKKYLNSQEHSRIVMLGNLVVRNVTAFSY
ncbi:Dabb family protein [Fulvivirga sp.]|uniref:Dabb family protein n=1 Tax=Fulvivirga sp. TaxID=1931237 RepID=UPI0032ED9CDE